MIYRPSLIARSLQEGHDHFASVVLRAMCPVSGTPPKYGPRLPDPETVWEVTLSNNDSIRLRKAYTGGYIAEYAESECYDIPECFELGKFEADTLEDAKAATRSLAAQSVFELIGEIYECV